MTAVQLSRERERLLEENRKLRLEKASLENLRRVETIARATWASSAPRGEQVVVERPQPRPPGAHVREPARTRERRRTDAWSALLPPSADAPPPAARERLVRLRLMLLALSLSLWALVILRPARAAPGAGRAPSTSGRPRARASARSTSTRGAAPSSTATATPSPSRWTPRASTRVPQDIAEPAAHRRRPGPRARPRRRGPQGPAGAAPEEPRLRLGQAQGRPRHARAVRDLQLDGIGFLTENRRYYPQARAGRAGARLRGPRQHGHERHRVRLRGAIRGRAAKVVVTTDARRRPVGHTEKPVAPTATPSCSPSTSRSSTWRSGSSSGPCRRRAPSPGWRW